MASMLGSATVSRVLSTCTCRAAQHVTCTQDACYKGRQAVKDYSQYIVFDSLSTLQRPCPIACPVHCCQLQVLTAGWLEQSGLTDSVYAASWTAVCASSTGCAVGCQHAGSLYVAKAVCSTPVFWEIASSILTVWLPQVIAVGFWITVGRSPCWTSHK